MKNAASQNVQEGEEPMNDKKTEAFVALCLALAEQAKTPTEATWCAMRAAQEAAERTFAGVVDFDVPWHAAQALCTHSEVYARYDRYVAKAEHVYDLDTMRRTFSDAVWAATVAVRKATEAK